MEKCRFCGEEHRPALVSDDPVNALLACRQRVANQRDSMAAQLAQAGRELQRVVDIRAQAAKMDIPERVVDFSKPAGYQLDLEKVRAVAKQAYALAWTAAGKWMGNALLSLCDEVQAAREKLSRDVAALSGEVQEQGRRLAELMKKTGEHQVNILRTIAANDQDLAALPRGPDPEATMALVKAAADLMPVISHKGQRPDGEMQGLSEAAKRMGWFLLLGQRREHLEKALAPFLPG